MKSEKAKDRERHTHQNACNTYQIFASTRVKHVVHAKASTVLSRMKRLQSVRTCALSLSTDQTTIHGALPRTLNAHRACTQQQHVVRQCANLSAPVQNAAGVAGSQVKAHWMCSAWTQHSTCSRGEWRAKRDHYVPIIFKTLAEQTMPRRIISRARRLRQAPAVGIQPTTHCAWSAQLLGTPPSTLGSTQAPSQWTGAPTPIAGGQQSCRLLLSQSG